MNKGHCFIVSEPYVVNDIRNHVFITALRVQYFTHFKPLFTRFCGHVNANVVQEVAVMVHVSAQQNSEEYYKQLDQNV